MGLAIFSSSTPTNGSSEELLRVQVKLLFSYFAVVLQLVWLARIPFHYRQKNAEIYSTLK
jgi:hypothetical protein